MFLKLFGDVFAKYPVQVLVLAGVYYIAIWYVDDVRGVHILC